MTTMHVTASKNGKETFSMHIDESEIRKVENGITIRHQPEHLGSGFVSIPLKDSDSSLDVLIAPGAIKEITNKRDGTSILIFHEPHVDQSATSDEFNIQWGSVTP